MIRRIFVATLLCMGIWNVYSNPVIIVADSLGRDTIQLDKRLPEVLVTAAESKKATSASVINTQAMQHLQPSGFGDLLELLPGGSSTTPNMNKANLIQIREAGSSSEVMSSLGVKFVIDGMALDNDANLQSIPGQDNDRDFVSKGVDMRSISTDNIESVEIVRGIASVVHGDLTSGLVNVIRKSNNSPFQARVKVDEYGKIFSAGKGFLLRDALVLNTDVSYVDSRTDPRNVVENYKRLSFSGRFNGDKKGDNFNLKWNLNMDYTGSFDNEKTDPEVTTAKEDRYKSTYNKASLSGGMKWTFRNAGPYTQLDVKGALSQSFDRLEQTKLVSLSRPTPVSTSSTTGVADGEYLPSQYVATMVVDGKPLLANLNLINRFDLNIGQSSSKILAGGEWAYKKNHGEGRVFDFTRPMSTSSRVRPRSYSEIPASSTMSFFVEENLSLPIGDHKLEVMAGVRSMSLMNLDSRFKMNGKVYLDPRFNLQYKFPDVNIAGHDVKFDISAGLGWQSKAPTLSMIYPDMMYEDIIQLNYYHNNPDYRKVNMQTYEWDNTNYDLEPARNLKKEIRAGASFNGYNISVTYFRENMNNGFRNTGMWHSFAYKNYDYSGIDSESITSAPQLEDMTFTQDTLMKVYNRWDNESRTDKEGVEFSMSTRRFELIKTRFTVTGAWFRTKVSNAGMQYYQPSSTVINGKPLNVVGIYNWENGSEKQSFNTNFMFDTYLRRLGLIFSTSLQCTWFSSSRPLWNDGTPVAYVDVAGNVHSFADADMSDPSMQALVQSYSQGYFDSQVKPFIGNLNLKATKEIGKSVRIALFVNSLVTVCPDYYIGSTLIRRSSAPYFGMELNIKI